MYYTIYKITNQKNGKIYVGKHQTSNLDDGYMGSGKLIRRAIAKHGLGSFSKEIIHVFDSEQEMNSKEAELVTEEFCKQNNYNLCPGGQGGFGFINGNGLQRKNTPEMAAKISATLKMKGIRPPKRTVWVQLSVIDDSGRKFDSVSEAAEFHKASKHVIWKRVRRGQYQKAS